MSETTDDATQGAPQGETAPQPETQTAPAPGTEQTPDETPKPDDKKPLDPRDRAIRQQAFESREAKREIQALREQLAKLQPPRDPNAPPQPADIDRIVEQRVSERIAQREQQAATEAWIAKGTTEFADFNERCNVLADMGAGENRAFMTAISKLPEGHKLLAELGANPAEAQRVLRLDPVSMAVELALRAREAASAPPPPPKPTTKAPDPIKPLAAQSKAEPDPSNMSEGEFQRWWNKRTRG